MSSLTQTAWVFDLYCSVNLCNIAGLIVFNLTLENIQWKHTEHDLQTAIGFRGYNHGLFSTGEHNGCCEWWEGLYKSLDQSLTQSSVWVSPFKRYKFGIKHLKWFLKNVHVSRAHTEQMCKVSRRNLSLYLLLLMEIVKRRGLQIWFFTFCTCTC